MADVSLDKNGREQEKSWISDTPAQMLSRAEELLAQADVPEPGSDARILLFHFLCLDMTGYLMCRNLPVVELKQQDMPGQQGWEKYQKRKRQQRQEDQQKQQDQQEQQKQQKESEKKNLQMQVEAFWDAVEKRCRRIPLQHILGTACFMGFDFTVNEDVLIPRPDTEILVETGLAFIASREDNRNYSEGLLETADAIPDRKGSDNHSHSATGIPACRSDGDGKRDITHDGVRCPELCTGSGCIAVRVLDLCTGSGCIAVSLKKLAPHIDCTASDISEKALDIARKNAKSLDADVRFVRSDLFDSFGSVERFDLIISNPPYIPTGVIPGLAPEVALHDPALALDGGDDGLLFYKRICEETPLHLNKGGQLCVEIGHDQGSAVKGLFEAAGFSEVALQKDLAGLDRVVSGTWY